MKASSPSVIEISVTLLPVMSTTQTSAETSQKIQIPPMQGEEDSLIEASSYIGTFSFSSI